MEASDSVLVLCLFGGTYVPVYGVKANLLRSIQEVQEMWLDEKRRLGLYRFHEEGTTNCLAAVVVSAIVGWYMTKAPKDHKESWRGD